MPRMIKGSREFGAAWQSMGWRSKTAFGAAGAAGGLTSLGLTGRSKSSPVSTGIIAAGISGTGLASAKYIAPTLAKSAIKSGYTNGAKGLLSVSNTARNIGVKKGAAIAGGVMAGVGVVRNVIGI